VKPQLQNLTLSTLEVRYRASAEPQLVTLSIQGNKKGNERSDYPVRVERLVDSINAGLSGGALFAPELGFAEVKSGPLPRDQAAGPHFAWSLLVRGVAPVTWAVILAQLSDSWSVSGNLIMGLRFEPDPKFYPSHISILGDLALDSSPASAETRDVLKMIADPSEGFQAWKDLPFPVRDLVMKSGAKIKVKLASTSLELEKSLETALTRIRRWLDGHPQAGWPQSLPDLSSTKSQIVARWKDGIPEPTFMVRGPILNVLRRFHYRVTPITSVELALLSQIGTC
jgi:hypothetical protein